MPGRKPVLLAKTATAVLPRDRLAVARDHARALALPALEEPIGVFLDGVEGIHGLTGLVLLSVRSGERYAGLSVYALADPTALALRNGRGVDGATELGQRHAVLGDGFRRAADWASTGLFVMTWTDPDVRGVVASFQEELAEEHERTLLTSIEARH